jgi:hypothetical protein
MLTDGQSASLSWNKAPIWGLRPYLYYCKTVAGLLIWGALSDERTESQSAVISLLSVCTIYILHVIKCIYNIYVYNNSVTAFTSLVSTLHGPHGKHRFYCWWRHRLRGSVFTESLLRNGLHNLVVPPLLGADDIENTTSPIVTCWTVFTELLPGNALIKSVTIFYISGLGTNLTNQFIFQNYDGNISVALHKSRNTCS